MKIIHRSILLVTVLVPSSVTMAADEKPWLEDSCDFVQKDLNLSAKKLVEEFLKRDSRGDFLREDEKVEAWRKPALH